MKFWIAIVLGGFVIFNGYAQQKPVAGIIFDLDSKERIAKVSIQNINTNNTAYNNLQAEFKILASAGDILIFSKIGYKNDTIVVSAGPSLIVYLKRTSIPLKEVTINDRTTNPQKQLLETKRAYSTVYGSIADHDLLTTGGNGGGAGLSIDGLYNMLSFRGRNATRLRAIIERDYHQNVIDYRFTHALVAHITGLTEPKLSDFMFKYRPAYFFVTESNDYELIKYIRTSYLRYKRNPSAYSIQPLQ